MNKFYKYIILLYILCFTIISCQQDDNIINNTIETNINNEQIIPSIQDNITGLTKVDIPEGITSVNIYNWADNAYIGNVSVDNGHIWVGSNNGSLTVKLYNAEVSVNAAKSCIMTRTIENNNVNNTLTDLGYIGDATIYKSADNVLTIQSAENINSGYNSNDFLTIFPGGKDNRNIQAPTSSTNFSHEVLYISDGNPFSIYPIYSLGWYDLTLGIFYYDEIGSRHDIDFWNMQAVSWKASYKYLSENKITDMSKYQVVKTENAEGYQITLPEHYVYGFYIYCNDDAKAGKYFSYSDENTCKEQHAVNIVDKNGINYVAFEDQDNGDWDINDLICYVNPKIPLMNNISTEAIQDELSKIQSVIIVPDNIDKIVHKTVDSCDVEARYDGKGHDYVRISKPLKNDEQLIIDIDSMNQYCQQDDTRIVTHDDITVIYCTNGKSDNKEYGNSKISIQNGCTNDRYGKITSCINHNGDKNDDDYTYQVKIDLYPKNEDCFNKIVKHMENNEWDKLFSIKK